MCQANKKDKRTVRLNWNISIVLLLLFCAPFQALWAALPACTSSQYLMPVTDRSGPNLGEHTETVEDMRIKVLGGYVRVTRTWDSTLGRWVINQRWAPLIAVQNDAGGDCLGGVKYPTELQYGGALYKGTDGNYTNTTNPKQTITLSEDAGNYTFRWQNRSGNWIDYETVPGTGEYLSQGTRIKAYGDRNNVQVSMRYDANGRLSGVLDHNNTQILWYEYNGNDITAIRDYSNRRVEYQGAGGKFTKVIDVRKNAWSYTYDGDKLKTKTDPVGRIITISNTGGTASILDQDGVGSTFSYEYDKNKREYYKQEKTAAGKVIETWSDYEGDMIRQDISGRTVFTLVKNGNTHTITDESGNKTIKELDQWNNVIKVTYPDGSNISKTYDPSNSRVLQETNENGVVTKYEYDANGNLIKKTEALGLTEQRVTTYTYDAYGNMMSEAREADEVTVASTTVRTYDAFGNIATVTDPEQNQTKYLEYDVMGNPLRIEDARGKVWVNAYDDAGNLTSKTNPLGFSTQYDYDAVNNLIKVTDAKNYIIQYRYNIQHRLIEVILPNTKSYKIEYDADGNRLKETDPEGRSKRYSYDLSGRLRTITDGNGNVIESIYLTGSVNGAGKVGSIVFPTYTRLLRYDRRGRQIKQIDKLAVDLQLEELREYDLVGNQTVAIDAKQRRTKTVYDALNRIVKNVDPLNGETLYVYDNRDNLLSVNDPENNTTAFQYDRANRKVRETRPMGDIIQYSYDPVGNLSTVIDAKGQLKRYVYDDGLRNTEFSYFASISAPTADKVVTLSYDNVGNLIGYNDGITSAIYSYNSLNQKLSESVNYGSFSKSYSYTFAGNGLKESFTGPDGVIIRYSYDQNNLLNSVQMPGGAFTVNSINWYMPSKITLPGGSTQEYNYDPLLRPKSITVKDPAKNTIMDYRYVYDAAGNIDTKQTEHGLYSYGYDGLDRLIQADNPALPDEVYAYDAVDNRLSDSRVPGVWAYNDNNQLTGIDSHTSFVHDANGSLTHKTKDSVVTNYRYNLENRLVEVSSNSTTIASYYYDPFGRRLWKDVSGQRTYFLYADEGLVAEFDNGGSLDRQYGYRPNGVWGSDPLYMQMGGQYYFYQNDHLGTPQKLINVTGIVAWSAVYQTFGEVVLDAANSIDNRLRFPGQYYDQETGLHYNYFRTYDPSTGRYITSDPIGLEGGLNTYSYVYGNPLRFIDSLGLAAECGDDEDCIEKCLKRYYGNMFNTALGLSFFSFSSFALGEYTEYTTTRGTAEANRNMNSGRFELGARQARSVAQLSRVNAVSSVLAAGASGFVAGAVGYCAVHCELNGD